MRNGRRQSTSTHNFVLAMLVLGAGCGGGGNQKPDGGGGAARRWHRWQRRRRWWQHRRKRWHRRRSIILQTCLPPAAIDQPAAKLSQTGCMDPTDTKKMAASVIPYEVNSPLWSDGADKQRGMALPDRRADSRQELRDDAGRVPAGRGRRRQVGAAGRNRDGEELPVRRQAGRDAPVRALRRRPRGLATATSGTRRRPTRRSSPTSASRCPFNTGQRTVTWHIPSRMDCMTCHTDAGGSTLGPDDARR